MSAIPGSEDEQQVPPADDGGGEHADEGETFEFAAHDEPLPWLEGEEYEEEGVDTGRIIGFAVMALLLLGAIVGGIWWAGRDRADPDMVADGSVIEAPDEPFKSRPENPGGKVHEGTGDTSFAVAEGQTRESQVAGGGAIPSPSIDREQGATGGGVGVQLGAYSSRDKAERGWSELAGKYSALAGLSHRIVEGQADIGTVYRLQAVAGSGAAASQLCNTLRTAGASCQVKN